MEQIQYCLKITQETSDKSDKQQKDLEETKQLLDASNKLVCQVSQRVQEMSQQMNVVTATITGLAKSVNEIARFMSINNQIHEPPQSGQPPTQIIPNLTPPETTKPPHNHYTTAPSQTHPPHKQEGPTTSFSTPIREKSYSLTATLPELTPRRTPITCHNPPATHHIKIKLTKIQVGVTTQQV
jgi:hypothetical protein